MTYSVRDVCNLLGVDEHSIYKWINVGALQAMNLAGPTAKKPRWKISQQALDEFCAKRTSKPEQPVRRSSKKLTRRNYNFL